MPAPPSQSPNLLAIFGGVERKGRWLVEPTTNVSCLFGGVEMTVPPGVRVVGSNVAIFGGTDLPEDDTADPDAPVIRLTGLLLFGGVSVQRRELDGKGGRRNRHREIHRMHQERHERRHGH